MENVNYIFVAIGAFLLGMLFIANLVRSIFAGFNRPQYYPARQDGTDDWTGTILLVLMLGAVAYLFVENNDFWTKATKADNSAKENINIEPKEQNDQARLPQNQIVAEGTFYENGISRETPTQENAQQLHQYDPNAEAPALSFYLRVNTLSDEHIALGLQYDYSLWIGEDLVKVAQDDEEKYHVLLGPFRTSEEATKLKVKYRGDVIFNPDYEFLKK